MKKILIFLISVVLAGTYAKAQQNIDEILRDPSNNYYTIKAKAEAWFAQKGMVGTGYKEYKRWEFLVKNNIDPDGTIPDFNHKNKEALDNFRSNNIQPDVPLAGVSNWIPLGQQDPTILAGDGQNGVGRISSIDFLGSDLWVSTPGGGMWFGDFLGGSSYSWAPRTDGIPNLAVQDIEICPSNTNNMYALTGAVGSASGYRSTGVLKSTDAGLNWSTTGLSFPESGSVKGYKLLSHPSNTNIVWACTDNGLYRTANGGTTWTLVTYYTTIGGVQTNFSSACYDIVYQPGSTTTMYATSSGPYFYRSTDGGLTFLRVDRAAAGLPSTGGRIQIGVSAANSAYIYLLYGDGSQFQALYRSTNSGTTFTLRSSTPNVLGSQAWRNICIDVSPTDVNDLYVGGLDVYKSTDGGVLWTQVSFWSTTNAAVFSHADIFELTCDNTYLWAATDGGIYRMTLATDSWISLMDNMQTGQVYRMGIDPTASAAFVTVGLQDNGTYRNSGAQYLSIGGADGMETIVRPSNTNVIYLSTQNGSFYRSDDGGSTNAFIRSGAGNWTTPAVLRPGFDTHIYIGYTNIDYNTTSGTGAWSTIATGFGSSGAIESLEFAPSNNTILYATDGSSIRRFNLVGAVWSAATVINGTLPALSTITELAVDPNNSSHVVISVGGYSATQKVFETFNANTASPTWTNITRNLPNVPINCIVMNDDVENSIYIGTDIGVFVSTDNTDNWIMYSNKLPVTRVYDLEINTALATSRIYAATFGRGVFYAEVYTGCIASTALSGAVTGLQYTEVLTSITSTQIISGGAGTSVGYNSGGTVTLNPGFEVKTGAKFEAYLQGCTGSGTPPRPLKPAVNTTPKTEAKETKPTIIQKPEGDN